MIMILNNIYFYVVVQYLTTFPNTSKLIKSTPASYLQLSFRCLEMWTNGLSCLIEYV